MLLMFPISCAAPSIAEDIHISDEENFTEPQQSFEVGSLVRMFEIPLSLFRSSDYPPMRSLHSKVQVGKQRQDKSSFLQQNESLTSPPFVNRVGQLADEVLAVLDDDNNNQNTTRMHRSLKKKEEGWMLGVMARKIISFILIGVERLDTPKNLVQEKTQIRPCFSSLSSIHFLIATAIRIIFFLSMHCRSDSTSAITGLWNP